MGATRWSHRSIQQPGRATGVAGGAAVLALGLALLQGCEKRELPFAQVLEISGAVSINTHRAAVDQVLAPDDLIEVPHGGSCKIRLRDESIIDLGGDNLEGTSLKLGHPTKGVLETTLNLARGVLGMSVPNGTKGVVRHQVEAPNCTASIEGTVFIVDAESNKTRVLCSEGAVRVRNLLGESVLVTRGRIAEIVNGLPPIMTIYSPTSVLGQRVDGCLDEARQEATVRRSRGVLSLLQTPSGRTSGLIGLAILVLLTVPAAVRRLAQYLHCRGRNCPHCKMTMEHYALMSAPATSAHPAAQRLVEVESMVGAARQQAIQSLCEELRRPEARSADASNGLLLWGAWCQRCQEGAIIAELRRGGLIVDEEEIPVHGDEGKDLLLMLSSTPRG